MVQRYMFKKLFQSKNVPVITREQALREGGYTREDGSNLSPDGRILLNGPTLLDEVYQVPDGVRFIFDYCFSKSVVKDGMTCRVVIPSSVVYIGEHAFDGCAINVDYSNLSK